MVTRTPKEVVEAYNYRLWNEKDYALGETLIADQVVRHYPGSVVTLSRDEAIQRVKDVYTKRFPKMEFKLPMLLADGEFVTLVYEMHAEDLEGTPCVYGALEIFRVVNGKICEVWNDLNDPELGPNGAWR